MIDIAITDKPLRIDLAEKSAASTNGAINIFIGTVRDHTDGQTVLRLEFEAYHSMAEKEMMKICDEMITRWHISKVVMHHREGTVNVGETAVLIAVGAERRDAAFLACRYAIDELKKRVPIWKKEVFATGATWVTPHP